MYFERKKLKDIGHNIFVCFNLFFYCKLDFSLLMTQKIYNVASTLNIPLHCLLKSGVCLLKPCDVLAIAKNFCFLKGINTHLPISN